MTSVNTLTEHLLPHPVPAFRILKLFRTFSKGTGALFLISLFLMVVFPTFIIPTLQYSYGSKFQKFKIPNGSNFAPLGVLHH
jgi:hypothetical protein